ncbi:S8 family peptidase [Kocuria coralli]|uniref:S8 family peptidase n=1 Tax=Kocuria coralli TaxID=1461025 RepID=UPI001C7005BE|nr:S8 family serine peptidase [Kocuria coralli]
MPTNAPGHQQVPDQPGTPWDGAPHHDGRPAGPARRAGRRVLGIGIAGALVAGGAVTAVVVDADGRTGLATPANATNAGAQLNRQPAPDGPAPSVPITDPTDVPDLSSPPAISAQQARAGEYWLDEYGVRGAWDEATGEGVKIAVIDTGVDGGHPDLEGAVGTGTDVSGVGASDGQEGLGAEPPHGTMVASVAAGRGHGSPASGEPGGGTGVIGVAPGAEILPVSTWLGTDREGVRSTDQQIPDAVRWAVDNDADIINMSVGSPDQTWPESWDSAFEYAEENDVLVVAAAGNRGNGITQVGAPATIPSVLTVGGVDRNDQAGWESSSQGISIAVAAPSEDLVGAVPGGGYGEWAGTSAAAPIVSGTAALIMEKYPDLSAQEVAHRITASARDVGASGRDPLYGYGILDVEAAVTQDMAPMEGDGPLGSMAEWIQIHRRHDSTPTATPSASASALTSEVTAEALPPEPVAPLNSTGALPVFILAGFGVLVAGITGAAAWHIRWLLRGGKNSKGS